MSRKSFLDSLLGLPVVASSACPEGKAFLVDRPAFDDFVARFSPGCPEPKRPFEKSLSDLYEILESKRRLNGLDCIITGIAGEIAGKVKKADLKFHRDAFSLEFAPAFTTMTGTVKMGKKKLLGYGVMCPNEKLYFGANQDGKGWWSSDIASLHAFDTVQSLLAYYNTHPSPYGPGKAAGFIAPGTEYQIGKVWAESKSRYVVDVDDQFLTPPGMGRPRLMSEMAYAQRFDTAQEAWAAARAMNFDHPVSVEIVEEYGPGTVSFEAVA